MKTAGDAMVYWKWDSGRPNVFCPSSAVSIFIMGLPTRAPTTGRTNAMASHRFLREHADQGGGFLGGAFYPEALRFIREQHREAIRALPRVPHPPAGSANLERSGIRPPKKYMDLYPEAHSEEQRADPLTISCMDEGVEQIISLVRQLGIDRKTLVMFFRTMALVGVADAGEFSASGRTDRPHG